MKTLLAVAAGTGIGLILCGLAILFAAWMAK